MRERVCIHYYVWECQAIMIYLMYSVINMSWILNICHKYLHVTDLQHTCQEIQKCIAANIGLACYTSFWFLKQNTWTSKIKYLYITFTLPVRFRDPQVELPSLVATHVINIWPGNKTQLHDVNKQVGMFKKRISVKYVRFIRETWQGKEWLSCSSVTPFSTSSTLNRSET